MNKHILRLLGALSMLWGLCLPSAGWAAGLMDVQTGSGGNRPRLHWFSAPQAEWVGERQLSVTFTVEVGGKLRSNACLHVQPFYVTDTDTIGYPELTVMTRRGYRYANRRNALAGQGGDEDAQILVKGIGSATAFYRRTLRLPTQEGGRLIVSQWMETCCETVDLGRTETIVASAIVASAVDADSDGQPVPMVKDELSAHNSIQQESASTEADAPVFPNRSNDPTGEREVTTTVRITFPVASAEVLPDFGSNAKELARVDSLLFRPMPEAGGICRIKSLNIVGYTSPEGAYNDNLALSLRRAEALSRWLREHYSFLASVAISTEGYGEDWEGLRGLVEASPLPHADEVLDIIDHVSIMDGREKRLMDLRGGTLYCTMLDQMFPCLRRMELKVVYAFSPTMPMATHP